MLTKLPDGTPTNGVAVRIAGSQADASASMARLQADQAAKPVTTGRPKPPVRPGFSDQASAIEIAGRARRLASDAAEKARSK